MNTVVLHVGTHKTGTTALQRAFGASRAALWRHGYVLSAALDPDEMARPDLDDARLEAARLRLARDLAAARGAALLVSGEAFSGDVFRGYPDTETIAHNLRRTLAGCDTRVVVYLRRQDQMLESVYAQSIQQGESWSFEEFRSQLPGDAFDWPRLLRALELVAGRSRLLVRVYEKRQLVGGDVVDDFCQLAGIPARSLTRPAPQANRSFGLPALELARAANRLLPPAERRGLRALLEATSAKRPFAAFSLLPGEERERWLARHEAGNREVARAWLGQDRLFLDPVDAGADLGARVQGPSIDDVVSVVTAALLAPRAERPVVRLLHRLEAIAAAARRPMLRAVWWAHRRLLAPGHAEPFGDPSLASGGWGLRVGRLGLGLSLPALALAWLASPGGGRPPGSPAVVVVSIGSLRPDHLGCYGYSRATSPEIDAFRRDAVLLRQAVASAPSALASQASLLTSLRPPHHGASVARGTALAPGIRTLPEVLGRAGFATASWNGGRQLDRSWGLDRGFQVYASTSSPDQADTLAAQVARATPWLERVRGKPFFLFLHTYQVHHPYAPPKARLRQLEPPYRGALPDSISTRLLQEINSGTYALQPGDLEHIVAAYDAGILDADSGFGDLLRVLRRLDLYEGATLVLTSDHGEALGEHGRVGWHGDDLFDEQIRIPLLVKLPGRRLAGTTIEGQVREIDVAPTILRALHLPVPSGFSGAPIDLQGGAPDHPPWAVASLDGNPGAVAVRTRHWKWYGGRLYDLRSDPLETRDEARSHSDIEHDLAARLDAILQSREVAQGVPVSAAD
jgi:arylsulfatase A-like enzyme